MYTEKVMEHFSSPKNAGIIEDADGIGEVGNPVCGDMIIPGNRIKLFFRYSPDHARINADLNIMEI